MTIIKFSENYSKDFRKLNMEWLEKYNLLEAYDLEILDNPVGMILDPGGFIFLAEADGEIVGSAGLIKESENRFELVKMAVSSKYQGRGISKMLMDACLEAARVAGAKRISLYSNSQLKTALKLYEKYGFRHLPMVDSPFDTADVRMEYEFQ